MHVNMPTRYGSRNRDRDRDQELGVGLPIHNPNIQEAEAGGSWAT